MTKMNKQIESIGRTVALKYGLTFGFLFLILFTVTVILFSGGLLGIIGISALLSYNYLFVSLILMYVSFPFALSIFGKKNARNIRKGKKDVKISAEFSFGVNTMIWLVFLISQSIFGEFQHSIQLNLIVLGLILILGTLTTFTLGLHIVTKTKEKIKVRQYSFRHRI
jgi:hypothetical protein